MDIIDLSQTDMDTTPKEHPLQPDGFHLNETSAKKNSKQDQQGNQGEKNTGKNTSPNKHRLGKRSIHGDRREEHKAHRRERWLKHYQIMASCNTVVTIKEKIKDGKTTTGAMIIGKDEDIEKTKNKIKERIDRLDNLEREAERRKESRKDIICSYYRYSNRCKFGSNCQYSHEIPREGTRNTTHREPNRSGNQDQRHNNRESYERRDRQRYERRYREQDTHRSRSPKSAPRTKSPRRRNTYRDEDREREQRNRGGDRRENQAATYKNREPNTRDRRDDRERRPTNQAHRRDYQRRYDRR